MIALAVALCAPALADPGIVCNNIQTDDDGKKIPLVIVDMSLCMSWGAGGPVD